MSEWFDIALTFLIIGFLILVIWSRIEHKEIMDILQEIKDFTVGKPEVVPYV
jgi:hypothetical protein